MDISANDVSSSDIVISAENAVINPISVQISTNSLEILDRIVDGTRYMYYYAYQEYNGNPVIILSNDVTSSGAAIDFRDAVSITFYQYYVGSSSNRVTHYAYETSYGNYSVSVGTDIAYTNVLPNYPTLGSGPTLRLQSFLLSLALGVIALWYVLRRMIRRS